MTKHNRSANVTKLKSRDPKHRNVRIHLKGKIVGWNEIISRINHCSLEERMCDVEHCLEGSKSPCSYVPVAHCSK